ncbi:MAG: aminoacyl-tRNA hydrolase [Patescibacteria group bacterium]|nr:aminoacyl-tRNA hydrolase [Patescibacteria group bacterium]
MKLIVGLGNPGPKYKNTRHNVGFMIVDEMARELNIKFKPSKSVDANYIRYETDLGKEVEIVKPTTFMNKSGVAIKEIVKKHNIKPEDILVVMDDLDMEVGKIRTRSEGSSGGHKGLQSIMNELQTEKIYRIKIGIGRLPGIEPDDYVTQSFNPEQKAEINKSTPEALTLIKEFLAH